MNSTEKPKAILYARVSTARQAAEGISLEGQERTLRQAAESAGYKCELFIDGGKSGKSMTNRLSLLEALEELNSGRANALYVTKLDRLARSVTDLLSIVDMASRNGWRLISLDSAIDTESPSGRFMLTVLGGFAELERGFASMRQKETHATRREQGVIWGIDKGNTPETPLAIRGQIKALRESGLGYLAIANTLNEQGTPTTRGGAKWHASTVRALTLSKSMQEVAA